MRKTGEESGMCKQKRLYQYKLKYLKMVIVTSREKNEKFNRKNLGDYKRR